MQILLSCSKDMTDAPSAISQQTTVPRFQREAEQIAVNMMKYDVDELVQILKINRELGTLNKMRYTTFLDPLPLQPAIFAHTGIAYKQLHAEQMTNLQLDFAQSHLWITSFLYGLLRPLDGIKSHRLEGYVRLPEYDDLQLFNLWRPLLTDVLIDSVKADDGILLHLASAEMKGLFDWKRVKREVTVVEPKFTTIHHGKQKTIVVYVKMCRGAMTRFVIEKQPRDIELLKTFDFEGFTFDPIESNNDQMVFTLEAT